MTKQKKDVFRVVWKYISACVNGDEKTHRFNETNYAVTPVSNTLFKEENYESQESNDYGISNVKTGNKSYKGYKTKENWKSNMKPKIYKEKIKQSKTNKVSKEYNQDELFLTNKKAQNDSYYNNKSCKSYSDKMDYSLKLKSKSQSNIYNYIKDLKDTQTASQNKNLSPKPKTVNN